MLKGVIFDMDGVLVDSHPIHERVWRRLFASLGKKISDEELEFIREGTKKTDILRYFLGGLSNEQVEAYGLQKEQWFREEIESVKPIPGIPKVLEELGNAAVPMAIASCGSGVRVHYTLNHLQLRKYFKVVITGDEVAIGKPDPAIFRKAAGQLQVHATDLLVFEDSVAGVVAAKAAGMKCVGIAEGDRVKTVLKAGADLVFSNFMNTSASHMDSLFWPQELRQGVEIAL